MANYGGGFRAIPPICPHMEEPLEESGVDRSIASLTCTKHLWAWDLRRSTMLGETEKAAQDLRGQAGRRTPAGLRRQGAVYEFEEDDDMTTTTFFK